MTFAGAIIARSRNRSGPHPGRAERKSAFLPIWFKDARRRDALGLAFLFSPRGAAYVLFSRGRGEAAKADEKLRDFEIFSPREESRPPLYLECARRGRFIAELVYRAAGDLLPSNEGSPGDSCRARASRESEWSRRCRDPEEVAGLSREAPVEKRQIGAGFYPKEVDVSIAGGIKRRRLT